MESFDEHSDMRLDNSITGGQFFLTSLDALLSYRFQVVNIIQRNIVEAAHRSIGRPSAVSLSAMEEEGKLDKFKTLFLELQTATPK